MNFGELENELAGRGFNHINTTRRKLWLNRAYRNLCRARPWPFLEATTSGTSPLTISDLGQVLSVTDTTQDRPLRYRDRRTVVELDPDLDDQGDPTHFYFEDTTTVVAWPASSNTISVYYLLTPPPMDAPTDEPVITDEDYQHLIIERAVVFAYRNSDNFEAADAVQADYNEGVVDMSRNLLGRNFASPERILNSSPALDA